MRSHDIAVVGLGGIGSAILAECARRNVSCLGIEQYQRGHDLGASSGKTRLFRKAYFEDARYVPLLNRAEEKWRELEAAGNEKLLTVTGLLLVGKKESVLLERSYRAAVEHQLPVERLSDLEIKERYPQVKLDSDEVGVFEPAAGVLKPEEGIAAHLKLAELRGATLLFSIGMTEWRSDGDAIVLTLADHSEIRARTLILALGPWFEREMKSIGVSLRIQRNVQAWFEPEQSSFRAGSFPAFLIERSSLPAPFYGFPDFGDGLKVAFHGHGVITSPEQVVRTVDYDEDVRPLVEGLSNWLEGNFSYSAAKPCLYSLTPDENFVIDRHPQEEKVILCGGFSGHGYKFAPVIGEIAAELALEGKSRHAIEFLSARRF